MVFAPTMERNISASPTGWGSRSSRGRRSRAKRNSWRPMSSRAIACPRVSSSSATPTPTDRPRAGRPLRPRAIPTISPPTAAGGAGDLGINATYLVFRQLKQDVAALEAFLAAAAPAQPERDLLAAKMVGRWPSGAPLVKAPERDDPRLGEDNDFGYQSDKLELRCPMGSHIRRANPRDSLGDSPAVSLASANRHRILRRGRLYGPRAVPGERDAAEQGLLFLCLNADIQRRIRVRPADLDQQYGLRRALRRARSDPRRESRPG